MYFVGIFVDCLNFLNNKQQKVSKFTYNSSIFLNNDKLLPKKKKYFSLKIIAAWYEFWLSKNIS